MHPIALRQAALAALLVASSATWAAAPRTFVSTSGSDSNSASNCGPTTPCRTFNVALAATNAGGEVVALNSGGYGTATITQAVSIVIPSGIDGAISVPAATSGITVNAPGALVVLRGLSITGQSVASTIGIDIVAAGRVVVQGANLIGLDSGISALSGGSLDVTASTINDCFTGIALAPATGTLTATVQGSNISGSTGDGIDVFNNALLSVDSSVFSVNGGYGVSGSTTVLGATIGVGVWNSRFFGNVGGGVSVSDTSGATTNSSTSGGEMKNTLVLGGGNCVNVAGVASMGLLNNTLSGCTVGVNAASGALVSSSGDNSVGSRTKTLLGGQANVPLPLGTYY